MLDFFLTSSPTCKTLSFLTLYKTKYTTGVQNLECRTSTTVSSVLTVFCQYTGHRVNTVFSLYHVRYNLSYRSLCNVGIFRTFCRLATPLSFLKNKRSPSIQAKFLFWPRRITNVYCCFYFERSIYETGGGSIIERNWST